MDLNQAELSLLLSTEINICRCLNKEEIIISHLGMVVAVLQHNSLLADLRELILARNLKEIAGLILAIASIIVESRRLMIITMEVDSVVFEG